METLNTLIRMHVGHAKLNRDMAYQCGDDHCLYRHMYYRRRVLDYKADESASDQNAAFNTIVLQLVQYVLYELMEIYQIRH